MMDATGTACSNTHGIADFPFRLFPEADPFDPPEELEERERVRELREAEEVEGERLRRLRCFWRGRLPAFAAGAAAVECEKRHLSPNLQSPWMKNLHGLAERGEPEPELERERALPLPLPFPRPRD